MSTTFMVVSHARFVVSSWCYSYRMTTQNNVRFIFTSPVVCSRVHVLLKLFGKFMCVLTVANIRLPSTATYR